MWWWCLLACVCLLEVSLKFSYRTRRVSSNWVTPNIAGHPRSGIFFPVGGWEFKFEFGNPLLPDFFWGGDLTGVIKWDLFWSSFFLGGIKLDASNWFSLKSALFGGFGTIQWHLFLVDLGKQQTNPGRICFLLWKKSKISGPPRKSFPKNSVGLDFFSKPSSHQLMVNCWFGARWFGIRIGVHPISRGPHPTNVGNWLITPPPPQQLRGSD